MLAEIRIESLGAISAATAEFDRGLTVLTGETGTGKTMVVTGLHLLGGARADATRVRSGADRAVVEGRFSTDELDPATAARIGEILDSSGADRDDDGSVIAMRTVSRDGPSRAFLGGRSVPAKSLSTLTTGLLTLHGQNDQLRLMRPDEQRAALDHYAGVGAAVERYRKLRDEWLIARRDLVDRTDRARELAQEADRLKFALAEIARVDPSPGEDERLVADIRRLSELDSVREAAAGARAALAGEDDAANRESRSATGDLVRAVGMLESTGDADLAGLARRVEELAGKVSAAAVKLSAKRTAAATGLAKAVTAELAGLAMADADFTLTVATMAARDDDTAPLRLPSGELAHAGSDGVDAVEFGFTAHRGTGGTRDGSDVLPLNKSASGGELSRVMLALEVVLAASAEGTTMVFDEIDAGVGGRAAVQIGRRLARLARTHQVIVVTHLPQVAAYADTHLVVDSGEGASEVRRLDDDDRVVELARMLAGLGESDTARAHARELLESARQEG